MKTKFALTILISLLGAFIFPFPARADGIIIPNPPVCDPWPCPPEVIPITQLVIKFHHVDVTIQDQIATTHVDQVFYNPNSWEVEGTYIFPIPPEAVVTNFTLWIDGQPVQGRVLDAEEARTTYEEIVRQMRDPALLEYVGRGAVQASIYPIPPNGERRIEIEYAQTLTAENGLVRYVYPLNTEKFSAWPLDSVRIRVEVNEGVPIRAVYSPSHPVAVNRDSENHVTIGYEEDNVLPDTDFALYYSLGESQAFHLLTYRDPGDQTDPDGFFVLLLAPRPDTEERIIPKDVILVLDSSGSMDGEKFFQAQEALRYILLHLNPEDRFNVIAFSTGLYTYASRLRTTADVQEALAWVDSLSAMGSTDINRALLEAAAMADRERPTYLIFLTDGLPTEGVTDSQQILNNLESAAPSNLRLFAFGVGYDVDTFLLDSLAQGHHGTSTYVLPGENLDETLSAFYAKISTPVLTDLTLDFGNVVVYDVFPAPLPDLFAGSQIVVVGRYRQGGETDVTLGGIVNGVKQNFRYPNQTFVLDNRSTTGPHALFPRLWATRKIGYLLSEIRLNGPDQETIDQIVRLSIRYGVVTPYTSYLVTEPMPLGSTTQEHIIENVFEEMLALPTALAYGQEAVEKAIGQGAMAEAEAPLPSAQEVDGVVVADVVRNVGARTFVYYDGVWMDTTFDPESMDTVKVAFLSDDYFALLDARPELAAAFALGGRVIAMSDGIAYEVVPSDVDADPIEIPEIEDSSDGPSTGKDVSQQEEGGDNFACLPNLLSVTLLPVVLLLWRSRS
ncbi:MAG: VIT domain-containing protein [Chloroflexota bacterium]